MKKTRHSTVANIFAKCWLIFIILSPCIGLSSKSVMKWSTTSQTRHYTHNPKHRSDYWWSWVRCAFYFLLKCISLLLLLLYVFRKQMKKALGQMQTLRAGCSKAELNIFASPQTPFSGARDGQNLISWRWSLPLPTNPVWWGLMHAISSYRGNRPTYPHTHPQTGPITIHCAAASTQCRPNKRRRGLCNLCSVICTYYIRSCS